MITSILVTGGAGFVGANLAIWLRRRDPSARVVAFDNLRRRGSEWNLPRLRDAGVEFVHGDVRSPEDLERLPATQLVVDCAAEPSVYASEGGSPRELLNINLLGTLNTLEYARSHGAQLLFLSTSRVYPIGRLNGLPFQEEATRFSWTPAARGLGISAAGVSEELPVDGPRSFYGAAKLASEALIQEYCHSYGMRGLINRCGILAGPWQFGKVDQGVVTLWMARHVFGDSLKYIGFGGTGKQVRDVLHIHDLFELLDRQLARPDAWDGRIYNVGGGRECSTSLCELTDVCQQLTGRSLTVVPQPDTHPLDVRIYMTDNQRVSADFGWRPVRRIADTLADIRSWLIEHADALRPLLA